MIWRAEVGSGARLSTRRPELRPKRCAKLIICGRRPDLSEDRGLSKCDRQEIEKSKRPPLAGKIGFCELVTRKGRIRDSTTQRLIPLTRFQCRSQRHTKGCGRRRNSTFRCSQRVLPVLSELPEHSRVGELFVFNRLSSRTLTQNQGRSAPPEQSRRMGTRLISCGLGGGGAVE